MNIEYLQKNGIDVAVVSGDETAIFDTQSALDLAMTVVHEAGAERIIIDKKILSGDFFVLSTGMAGEILQKLVNYHVKAAVYGDFSHYTSKPLKDFMYESNQGTNFFFVATREEAIQKLTEIRKQP